MKDVRVPEQLMRAMAAEAEAARDARAKVLIMMMTTTKMMVMVIMMTTTKMMVILMMTTTKMMVTMMLDLFVQVIAAEGEHKASR